MSENSDDFGEDGAFSVKEFRACYGIGKTKTYEEIAAGRLVAKKVGARTLISRGAARSWFVRLPDFLARRQR